jgi:hypothetical protein
MRSINGRRTKSERQLIDVRADQRAVRLASACCRPRGGGGQGDEAPCLDEFRRVAREVGLGMSLGKALTNLLARMQNQ